MSRPDTADGGPHRVRGASRLAPIVRGAADAGHPHAAEHADPHCLPEGDAAALLVGAPWRRLVVMGDSVAQGICEPLDGYRDVSAADRIAEALAAVAARRGEPFRYDNLGVFGLRAAEVLASQLEPARALRPDLVVLSAGGNDALGRRFDAAGLRAALSRLVGELTTSGALVVTVGLFDLARSGVIPEPHASTVATRFAELDAITLAVGARHGALHADARRHPAGRDPGIYSSDGIHCNARGHAIAAALTLRGLAGRIRTGRT